MTQIADGLHRGTRHQLTRFAFKSMLLVVTVIFLQLAAVRLGYDAIGAFRGADNEYEITVGQCDDIVRTRPEVLYFGDSTVYPMSVDEDDRRTTPEMLAALMPERSVEGFYGVGLTPDFFAAALEYFARRDYRPEVIIVPVNIRAFSNAWRTDPKLQFGDIRSFLKHDSTWYRAFQQPLHAFGLIDAETTTNAEYFEAVQQQITNSPAHKNFVESMPDSHRLAAIRDFAYYGVPITFENTLLDSLVRMRETSQALGARMICYITPVDYGNIDKHLGAEVAEIARNNVVFMDQWLRGQGFDVLNLDGVIEASEMHPVEVTSSHLVAAGRLHIARELRSHIETSGR